MKRITARVGCVAFGLVLAAAGGCSPKLDLQKSFDATINGEDFTLGATRREQKIKVSAAATGGKIDVYIFLEKNKEAATKDILAKKTSANVLAKEEKADSVNLTATIPAGEEAVVRVTASSLKQTKVSLKITNQ